MIYRILEILGNRHAGFILCLIVVTNLAAGKSGHEYESQISILPFFHLILSSFFSRLSAVHWWLYLLLVTFSLFAINMVACFIESLIRIRSTTIRQIKAVCRHVFIHAALILTMTAHIYDGFYGSSGQATLSPDPVIHYAGIGRGQRTLCS